MKKLLLILLVGVGFFQWYAQHNATTGRYGAAHDRVIMYSLTTCGYCKEKAEQLRAEGIRFTEYYIDEDESRRDELNTKLSQAGFPPQGYGTPILDVHGAMLPNNPSLAEIKKHMQHKS